MALLLDLTQLRGPRERIERSYAPGVFESDAEDFRVAGDDVRLAFDIEKQGTRYRLVGDVRAALELPCSRCLEPISWPVDSHFDIAYLPMSANAGRDEREIEDDDLGVAFYENDTIDLGQLIREQFLLTVPMKPLC